MEKPLLTIENVTKRFEERTVLDQISFSLHEGEIITIIGKSGVGKSVLLKHLIGLLQPDEGSIYFRQRSIHEMDAGEKDAFLSKISYMFQNNALFDSLNVYNNIAMPLSSNRNTDRNTIHEKVVHQLELLELTSAAEKFPDELSGGMQKRVALARALITAPEIVLFDEPTTGQDPIRKDAILGMIRDYQKQYNFTAVLVSHDLPDIFFISSRILVLYENRIIFIGTPEEFEHFDHPFRSEIIGSLKCLPETEAGFSAEKGGA